jgi:DNA-binding CsgD family transcriptional regulator
MHEGRKALQGRDAPAALAALEMSKGLIHEREGRATEADTAFAAAETALEALPRPYARAQAREARAGVSGEASAHLTAALAWYEELGATWDAARVRQRLRQLGETSWRGGRRTYGSELSPREHEVVQLVANGFTSREIGQQLFLSTRTVDDHVARAMRKLGAKSRRELLLRGVSPADVRGSRDA